MTVHDFCPWDIEARYSDAAMARIFRAVVECRGQITDTCFLEYKGSPRHTWPLLVRLKLPPGAGGKFTEISGYKLQVPPKVVGL